MEAMNGLNRRDVLKYPGIGGALLFTKVTPLRFIESAFSEEIKGLHLTAAITNDPRSKDEKARDQSHEMTSPTIL